MTLIYMLLCKYYLRYSRIINYFIIQEVVGLLFLFFSFSVVQLFLLFLKVGVAPFHFWLFSVLWGVYDYSFLWFLTFQKLPFIMVFFNLSVSSVIFSLLLGLFLCYLQIFLVKSFIIKGLVNIPLGLISSWRKP